MYSYVLVYEFRVFYVRAYIFPFYSENTSLMGLCSSAETYNASDGDSGLTVEEEETIRKNVAKRGRRISVSAESGEGADVDFVPPKIPKTEEQSQRIAAVVQKVFLFQGLSTTELDTIIGAMSEKKVDKGTELIKQGGVGDFFYVVDKGAFDVFVTGLNEGKKVFDYKAGGAFGELAVSTMCSSACCYYPPVLRVATH